MDQAQRQSFWRSKHSWTPYILSLAIVGLVFFLEWHTQTLFVLTDLIIFCLLAVVLVAIRWGHGPAIVTSVASALAFDFFFVLPQMSFGTFSQHDLITIGGFLMVGIITSTLTVKVRESIVKAQQIELLREKEKLYATLLNSVSHDLKTPLASISATLSNLLYNNKALDERTREQLIETAYGESGRLNQLVENLLDMARVEGGTLKLSLKPCEINDFIGFSLRQFSEKQIDKRPINIRIMEKLPELPIDYALMTKVLVNIIDNAIKYSPRDDSPVDIEAKQVGDKLQIEIADEGLGIPENDLNRVFDKFYRVDRSQKIPGTGLGLSICKGIVEAHQGKIYAKRRHPKGTRIVILLPLTLDEGKEKGA